MRTSKNHTPFFKAVLSVFAAAFGVQSRKNMERDLSAHNPTVYVVATFVFLAVFIGGIIPVSYTHLTLPTTPYV